MWPRALRRRWRGLNARTNTVAAPSGLTHVAVLGGGLIGRSRTALSLAAGHLDDDTVRRLVEGLAEVTDTTTYEGLTATRNAPVAAVVAATHRQCRRAGPQRAEPS